jgi:hypothetical protein
MLMKFVFDESKAKKLGITLDMCYSLIYDFMQKQGVFIESQNGFDAFAKARILLPKSSWFIKVIDQWYWFDDESDIDYLNEGYDCLASYRQNGV